MTERSDDMEPHGRGALCEMLRAIGHGTHDDLSLAFEAADEIERLMRGIKEIDRLLTEGRPADAHYICEAMYCGVDEQTTRQKPENLGYCPIDGKECDCIIPCWNGAR